MAKSRQADDVDMIPAPPHFLTPSPPHTPSFTALSDHSRGTSVACDTTPAPPSFLQPKDRATARSSRSSSVASTSSASTAFNTQASYAPRGVLIVHHSECISHCVRGHPDSPERILKIKSALRKRFPKLHRCEAPLATEEQLLSFHTPEYITQMNTIFQEVADLRAHHKRGVLYRLDIDTCVTIHTQRAALRAAGSGCLAVDKVLSGQYGSAFCLVRPPGHHAEPHRALGFCIFSNAGIAAHHARKVHGLRRVAVIDQDVHHGNGTAKGFEKDPDLFYASTHQDEWFPWSGRVEETGIKQNLVHVCLRAGDGSAVFRQAYEQTILPRLRAFKPELIIISAGFDAHLSDPLGQINLEAQDFAWLMHAIVAVARQCNNCPVISMLEGGYNIHGLVECAVAHVGALVAEYGVYPDASPYITPLGQPGLSWIPANPTTTCGEDVARIPATIAQPGPADSFQPPSIPATYTPQPLPTLSPDLLMPLPPKTLTHAANTDRIRSTSPLSPVRGNITLAKPPMVGIGASEAMSQSTDMVGNEAALVSEGAAADVRGYESPSYRGRRRGRSPGKEPAKKEEDSLECRELDSEDEDGYGQIEMDEVSEGEEAPGPHPATLGLAESMRSMSICKDGSSEGAGSGHTLERTLSSGRGWPPRGDGADVATLGRGDSAMRLCRRDSQGDVR